MLGTFLRVRCEERGFVSSLSRIDSSSSEEVSEDELAAEKTDEFDPASEAYDDHLAKDDVESTSFSLAAADCEARTCACARRISLRQRQHQLTADS